MSIIKKIIHILIPFTIGLFNGYLIMVILGYVNSYLFFITKWIIDYSIENHMYYFYPILDFITQIIYLSITTFIIIYSTRFLLQYSLKSSLQLSIWLSSIGLLVLPFFFTILPSFYVTLKHDYSIHQIFISFSFFILLITSNRYILKKYSHTLNL